MLGELAVMSSFRHLFMLNIHKSKSVLLHHCRVGGLELADELFALAKSVLTQTNSIWRAGLGRLLLIRVEPTQDTLSNYNSGGCGRGHVCVRNKCWGGQ